LHIEVLIQKVTKVWSSMKKSKVMLQNPKKKSKLCWREVIISAENYKMWELEEKNKNDMNFS
jgi:hypothetical protein